MANKTQDKKVSPLYTIMGNPFEEVQKLAKQEKCPFDHKEYKRVRVRAKESNDYIEIEHTKTDYCYVSATDYKYVLPRLVALYWASERGLVEKEIIENLVETVILMGKAEAKKNPKFREEFVEELKEIVKELSQ